ncbi:MAG: alpha/beta hydrolase [Erysipelothrix sp.]
MTIVFVHGLGQDKNAWDEVIQLVDYKDEIIIPQLNNFEISGSLTYENLYQEFCVLCHRVTSVNLCGLSLGAILCLNYAIDYPEKVNSLAVIAPQYKIPKKLFKVQNTIFKLLPKSTFTKMGFSKEDTLSLVNSMGDLDFTDRLKGVNCPTLIVCGAKDNANIKAAKSLQALIPNSIYEEIPNSKHEINKENPSGLADKLNQFIDRELSHKMLVSSKRRKY